MVACRAVCKFLGKVRRDVFPETLIALHCSRRNHSSLHSYPHIAGREVTPENQHECLADVITPLWQVPYEEQLNMKNKWTDNIVNMFQSTLRKQKLKLAAKYGHPVIEEIKPSPVTQAYRNKDELHIRNGVDGDPKTLGYFVGSPAEGSAVCVPGLHIITAKPSHKEIAQAFQIFLRQSKLAACHDFHDNGYWRGLLIRSTENGETMAVALCHPRDLSEEQLKIQHDELRQFFQYGEGKHCTPTSLYFQACPNTRCTHQEAPFILLHGMEYLTEYLNGLAFRISPDSFFQVNVHGAKVLYSTVLRLIKPSPITTLLDVCCGTGTISLLASSHVRGCVGIEAVQGAVDDAQHNAKINNIDNAHFFVGRVEKRLHHVLKDLDMAPNIVAVVNPSRQGVEFRFHILDTITSCSKFATTYS